MAYEIFERSAVRVGDPTLSVLPDGRIALNAAASRLFQGAGVRAVRVLWDKRKYGIALQAVDKGEDNSYSVSFSRGRSASISAKAFLSHIAWSSTKRQTTPAKWDPERRMLEAALPARFIGRREQRATAKTDM